MLARALTHSSFANEHPPGTHNEALALLGDAALSLVVARHLYRADPDASVGDLTSRRAEIVPLSSVPRLRIRVKAEPERRGPFVAGPGS